MGEIMTVEQLNYAGFWRRFGSFWLDVLVYLPVIGFALWAGSQSRMFHVYFSLPSLLIALWYHVYLVQRYGGTPGKLILGVNIKKIDGTAVDMKTAFLRHSVEFVFSILGAIATSIAILNITDAQYLAVENPILRLGTIKDLPGWYKPIEQLSQLWIFSEFIVMLTNKKRRALHDFIAGTVVVVNRKPI